VPAKLGTALAGLRAEPAVELAEPLTANGTK
jgi:hypothetical protein